MNIMTKGFFSLPAELFLGSDRSTALAAGPRHFTTSAKALRFALEQAAPVSLRGARLRVGSHSYGPAAMGGLYARLAAAKAA